MNHVERFRAVMDFQPVDRLPRREWAMCYLHLLKEYTTCRDDRKITP
jgi:hypothetical protein